MVSLHVRQVIACQVAAGLSQTGRSLFRTLTRLAVSSRATHRRLLPPWLSNVRTPTRSSLIIALQFNHTDRPVQDIDKNGIVNSIDMAVTAQQFNKFC